MNHEPRMPIRDADLREAVVEAGLRPGDALWRLLVELQARRDADRGKGPPRSPVPVLEREGGP